MVEKFLIDRLIIFEEFWVRQTKLKYWNVVGRLWDLMDGEER